jgi:hypothetical protein
VTDMSLDLTVKEKESVSVSASLGAQAAIPS